MPWIDKKFLSSNRSNSESMMELPFPTSLTIGFETMVSIELRNIGAKPCYLGVRWIISDPIGEILQTVEKWLPESQINVNGRFAVQGPLFPLLNLGPYTIKIDALISNTTANVADATVAES